MAFKLLDSAQARWRALTARHLVALVRAGARFEKGEARYFGQLLRHTELAGTRRP